MHIHIFRREPAVRTLGPGLRAVVWVQGCTLRCPGCLAPESWDPAGGEAVEVEDLAAWVLGRAGIEGVTVSGGEPFEQAEALVALVDAVRAGRDLGWMAYSGYALEWLTRRGTEAQRALLARLDLLVDGPYVEERHASLLWRASSNQRVHSLTPRYAAALASPALDRSAGLEFACDADGRPSYVGVPPVPRFRERFEAALRDRGVTVSTGSEEAST